MTLPALLRRTRHSRTEESTPIDCEGGSESTVNSEASSNDDLKDAADQQDAVRLDTDDADEKPRRRIEWGRLIASGLLPGLALLLAISAGYLKWWDSSARSSALAATESVHAATDGAIAMLSYRPDTADKDLGAARDRLTGSLKDSYTGLTRDVVIPGAKQRHISATATVPAAASVSASPDHAVVLVFVDQTVAIGGDPPTNSASRVRMTLDHVDGRWLISGFDPI
jgi:Mce-associated membrane protein